MGKPNFSKYDMLLIVLGLPGIAWKLIPRLSVSYRIVESDLSCNVTYIMLVGCMLLFWCLLLEFRRRRLTELLECVSNVEEETSRLVISEPPSVQTVENCVRLLESTFRRYDHLQLLQDALKRDKSDLNEPLLTPSSVTSTRQFDLQHPPIIEEESNSDMLQLNLCNSI